MSRFRLSILYIPLVWAVYYHHYYYCRRRLFILLSSFAYAYKPFTYSGLHVYRGGIRSLRSIADVQRRIVDLLPSTV